MFGDYFNPANQSYNQYPVGKKSVFWCLATQAFFLTIQEKINAVKKFQ